MKAVIIAAGKSSRIGNQNSNKPKTLLPFGNGTILSNIMDNLHQAGVNNFVIVVGYKSEHIRDYLNKNNCFGYNIKFIENHQWDKGNGISVKVAEPEVAGEDFLLSMSDHIVSINSLESIIQYKSRKNLLLVDRQIEKTHDIDDATKVVCDGGRILNIGKELSHYNGIDCGIFRLNDHFFRAIDEALKNNRDSISSAIKVLIEEKDMSAVFLKSEDQWIDIDTHQAYQYALENIKL